MSGLPRATSGPGKVILRNAAAARPGVSELAQMRLAFAQRLVSRWAVWPACIPSPRRRHATCQRKLVA